MTQIIPTALLSYGMSGRLFHAPFLHLNPGFKLLGAWERSKKLIQSDYPGVKSYSSMEELLADSGIDLVIVNTPSYTHFEYAKKSLEAGKHVVVEKPFTATANEALELKKLAQAKGKKLTVFQNRRWDSDFLTVRDILNNNLLGEIVEATISYDRYNPALSPKLHKETPSSGSGIIMDLSPHLIDQALVLFGFPESVFADIQVTRAMSLVDDYFEILLYYPNLRVRLKSGYFVREPVASYILHGKKGTFLKSRSDVQEPQLLTGMKPDDKAYGIEPESAEGFLHTEKDGVVVREKIKTFRGNYMEYYNSVYRALAHGEPFSVTVDDAIQTMRIMDAARKSNVEKRVVELSKS